MSEERFYELGPKFEEEEGIKDEQTQSIPPISTFAKRSGNASEEFSPSTPSFFSNNNGQSMEGNNNNNNGSPIPDDSSPDTSPDNSKPSEEAILLLHQAQQQPPPQHQSDQLMQQHPGQSAYQYGNPPVHVSTAAPATNGIHVIHSGPVPTSVLPSGIPMQGTLIPFLTSNNAAQPQGVISHLPAEQMLQYSSAASHFATPQGIQTFTSQPQPTVIQVNDTIPVQPMILPHNIDLHHHVQQHQQQQQQQQRQEQDQSVKDAPPLTPPASADEKDKQDGDPRKLLATITPHSQLQSQMQNGAAARSMLPAHLMQYNPVQSVAALPGHLPTNFAQGPGPVQGQIATGNYGNVQVIPAQQLPPMAVQHQMVPPGMPSLGEQQNPMLGGSGPGMDMQGGMDSDQSGSGSSGGKRHSNKRRGNKRDVPVEEKDDRYFERRKRNNQAAKRSRDARKNREEQIGMRAHYLEKENDFLRAQLNTLREEANSLRLLLAQRPPVSQMPPSGPPQPM